MSDITYISLNGELLPEEEAGVSPINRGMMYGDGCFETLRSYEGRFLAWDQHINRAKAGLHYLGLGSELNSDTLLRHCQKLLHKNNLAHTDAMLRIQWWREGGRGYYDPSTHASYIIQCNPLPKSRSAVKLCVAETRCIPSEALERKHKLSNGLNYIKAAQEANTKACDDALMINMDGFVSETTSSNVFWIKDETVFTPSITCDLLPGITRSLILQVLADMKLNLEEGSFDLSTIGEAESVFMTNSIREIEEVYKLEEKSFQTGHPVLSEIRSGFESLKQQELSDE